MTAAKGDHFEGMLREKKFGIYRRIPQMCVNKGDKREKNLTIYNKS